jgi:hypothetical protein
VTTAGIGSDDERDEETQGKAKTRREWATVAQNRTQNERGNLGHSCLPFSKAGLGYLFTESESVAIHCTLRRERESEGRENEGSKGVATKERTEGKNYGTAK